MSFSIEVEDNIVVVTLAGSRPLEDALASCQEAAQLASRKGITRVLADITETTSSVPTTEAYAVCSHLAEVFDPGVRIALVYSPERVPAPNARFAETVAMNRGVMLRAFSEADVARKWIGALSSPSAR